MASSRRPPRLQEMSPFASTSLELACLDQPLVQRGLRSAIPKIVPFGNCCGEPRSPRPSPRSSLLGIAVRASALGAGEPKSDGDRAGEVCGPDAVEPIAKHRRMGRKARYERQNARVMLACLPLPPSSSGLGRRPFKAVTGIRIPLGAPWGRGAAWSARRPVKPEAAGSNPVVPARIAFAASRPFQESRLTEPNSGSLGRRSAERPKRRFAGDRVRAG